MTLSPDAGPAAVRAIVSAVLGESGLAFRQRFVLAMAPEMWQHVARGDLHTVERRASEAAEWAGKLADAVTDEMARARASAKQPRQAEPEAQADPDPAEHAEPDCGAESEPRDDRPRSPF